MTCYTWTHPKDVLLFSQTGEELSAKSTEFIHHPYISREALVWGVWGQLCTLNSSNADSGQELFLTFLYKCTLVAHSSGWVSLRVPDQSRRHVQPCYPGPPAFHPPVPSSVTSPQSSPMLLFCCTDYNKSYEFLRKRLKHRTLSLSFKAYNFLLHSTRQGR